MITYKTVACALSTTIIITSLTFSDYKIGNGDFINQHSYVVFKNEKSSVFENNTNVSDFGSRQIVRMEAVSATYNSIGSTYFVESDRSAHMSSRSDSILFRKNIEKLDTMAKLEDNWDGENARSFDPILISNVKKLLAKLDQFQPNIFPTSKSNIQAEFYVQDDYLELVLSVNKCEVYMTDGKNLANDVFEDFDYDENKVVSVVQRFYAKTRG